ncbi:ribonuclease P protein subunit [archaeon]|nr:ribonuclease P protein subunit [archaeon]
MKSSKKNLKQLAEHTIIGLKCEITNSSQRNIVGLKGKIIDETLNTITIETKNGEKQIQKKTTTFQIHFPTETIEIKGTTLTQRPHERLRKIWRKIK